MSLMLNTFDSVTNMQHLRQCLQCGTHLKVSLMLNTFDSVANESRHAGVHLLKLLSSESVNKFVQLKSESEVESKA